MGKNLKREVEGDCILKNSHTGKRSGTPDEETWNVVQGELGGSYGGL